MSKQRQFVEFFGGPLDGHRQDVSGRPIPKLLHLAISSNTYSLLARKQPTPDAPTTSVAVYELKIAAGAGRYHFVAARKPATKPAADR